MKKDWKKIRAVSLDVEVAVWLEGVARRDNRSASNYVATLLMRMRDGEMPMLPVEEGAEGLPPAEMKAVPEEAVDGAQALERGVVVKDVEPRELVAAPRMRRRVPGVRRTGRKLVESAV